MFTDSEWDSTVVFRLESTFRSTNAVEVGVRLFDETAAAAVASSEIISSGTTLDRKRSGVITMADGNQHRIQVGVEPGATGAIIRATVLGLSA